MPPLHREAEPAGPVPTPTPPDSYSAPPVDPGPPVPSFSSAPPPIAQNVGDQNLGSGLGGGGFGTEPGGAPSASSGRVRYEFLVGGPLVAVVLAVVLVLLLVSEPEGLEVTPHEPEPTGIAASEAVVELAEPVDRVDHVELTWSSSRAMDFVVVIAEEGAPKPTYEFAGRENSITVPVEPGRRYCFLVQGTDSVRTYESEPEPLRQATCAE